MRHSQATIGSAGPNDSGRPTKMLASYLCNMGRGRSTVRGMIVNDINRFTELGAERYVSDLIRTLHLFDHARLAAEVPMRSFGRAPD
jgi:hypothetical protein